MYEGLEIIDKFSWEQLNFDKVKTADVSKV